MKYKVVIAVITLAFTWLKRGEKLVGEEDADVAK